MMKALRLVEPGRPLVLQEIPMPKIGPRDVLVRVMAAGICHSDAHYRAGRSATNRPLTPGHEVAGVVEQAGSEVRNLVYGDRVCIHYLATCGTCDYCRRGTEQFCGSAAMIGKHRDGGFAEFIAMPAASLVRLPREIPFEHGAIMMCSSATSLHALKKARLTAGESVAVFGVGGLGTSAIQLAKALGAGEVFAVDIKPKKLELARQFAAVAINARECDPVAEIKHRTSGRGVDIALELVGLPLTMQQSVRSLAIQGRAVLVGITDGKFSVAPYAELINKETEIIGVSDHLASELPQLIEFARDGRLKLSHAISRTVPLNAKEVNDALDQLEEFTDDVRMVITPRLT